MEHQTLCRWVVCPIDPASQRIILKIVGFLVSGRGILSELILYYYQFGRTWPVFSSLSDLCKGMNVIVKMETESHSLEHIWPWSKLLDTIIAPFFGQLTFFSKLFFLLQSTSSWLQSKLILTYSRHSRLNSFRSL